MIAFVVSVVEYIKDVMGLDSSVMHMIILSIAFGIPHMIETDRTDRITFVVLEKVSIQIENESPDLDFNESILPPSFFPFESAL